MAVCPGVDGGVVDVAEWRFVLEPQSEVAFSAPSGSTEGGSTSVVAAASAAHHMLRCHDTFRCISSTLRH